MIEYKILRIYFNSSYYFGTIVMLEST